MTRRKQRNGESTRCAYQVEVRGEIPGDLKQRISALHALCIFKGREGQPPGESDDVQETEEENPALEIP